MMSIGSTQRSAGPSSRSFHVLQQARLAPTQNGLGNAQSNINTYNDESISYDKFQGWLDTQAVAHPTYYENLVPRPINQHNQLPLTRDPAVIKLYNELTQAQNLSHFMIHFLHMADGKAYKSTVGNTEYYTYPDDHDSKRRMLLIHGVFQLDSTNGFKLMGGVRTKLQKAGNPSDQCTIPFVDRLDQLVEDMRPIIIVPEAWREDETIKGTITKINNLVDRMQSKSTRLSTPVAIKTILSSNLKYVFNYIAFKELENHENTRNLVSPEDRKYLKKRMHWYKILMLEVQDNPPPNETTTYRKGYVGHSNPTSNFCLTQSNQRCDDYFKTFNPAYQPNEPNYIDVSLNERFENAKDIEMERLNKSAADKIVENNNSLLTITNAHEYT